MKCKAYTLLYIDALGARGRRTPKWLLQVFGLEDLYQQVRKDSIKVRPVERAVFVAERKHTHCILFQTVDGEANNVNVHVLVQSVARLMKMIKAMQGGLAEKEAASDQVSIGCTCSVLVDRVC